MTLTARLGIIAGALGTLALFAGSPYPADVDAITLATWIRAQRSDLRVVDLRPKEYFDAFHIPTATSTSIQSLIEAAPATADTIVVYDDDGREGREAVRRLRAGGRSRSMFLQGGVASWLDDVVQPSPEGAVDRAEILAKFARMKRRGC